MELLEIPCVAQKTLLDMWICEKNRLGRRVQVPREGKKEAGGFSRWGFILDEERKGSDLYSCCRSLLRM